MRIYEHPYEHPILLPEKHPFIQLIIVYEHEQHLHAEAQAMYISGYSSKLLADIG